MLFTSLGCVTYARHIATTWRDPAVFVLNPYPNTYNLKGEGRLFVKQIGGSVGGVGGEGPGAGGFWEMYSPEGGHVSRLGGLRKPIVGVTEYLKNECKLAGFIVLENKPEIGETSVAWCEVHDVKSRKIRKGIPLVTRDTTLEMDVEWRCGIERNKESSWERAYFGQGSARLGIIGDANAITAMRNRAYTRAMESIVFEYVNDLIRDMKRSESTP